MHDMGLRPNTPYRKSARIVGEVLGKYHPHGDPPSTMRWRAWRRTSRCATCWWTGRATSASVDGDAPAAMRYTEARLSTPAMEVLADLEKNTVDFGDNFDGTQQEPTVLPAAVPNLSSTAPPASPSAWRPTSRRTTWARLSMPSADARSHRRSARRGEENAGRGEVPEAEIDVDDLMKFIKGPDFPTGGIIFRYNEKVEGGDAIRTAYATGRGKLIVQAKAHIEEGSAARPTSSSPNCRMR